MAEALAPWLIALAVGAAAWCLFWPDPYGASVAVNVVLPWIAVAVIAASKGDVLFEGPSGTGKPCLAWVLIAATAALFWDAEVDAHTLNDTMPILLGAVLGAGLILAHTAADRMVWRRASWIFIPFMLVYGWATVDLSNVLLDRSAPQTFQTTVESKFSTSGRTIAHYLVLAPWGPRHDTTDLKVHFPQYTAVQTGAPACVQLHDGAFGIPWFAVACLPPPKNPS